MKDKRNVIIIAVILAVVASLMFLLVTVTPNFIVAYFCIHRHCWASHLHSGDDQ